MAHTIRLNARVERPTFQKLQAVGMTAVAATGGDLLRRRDTFDVGSPAGYFRSDISREISDGKDLAGWNHYRNANRRHSSRVSGLPLLRATRRP